MRGRLMIAPIYNIAERQVAEFVEDDEAGIGKPAGDLPGLPLRLLLFEGVDEFDGGEEPDASSVTGHSLVEKGGSIPGVK